MTGRHHAPAGYPVIKGARVFSEGALKSLIRDPFMLHSAKGMGGRRLLLLIAAEYTLFDATVVCHRFHLSACFRRQ